MKVLVDECVDRYFASEIVGHEVSTVPQMGWAGKRNGELLGLAAGHFDAFVTVDQGLPHQQNLSKFDIAIVILAGESNRMVDLMKLMGKLLNALDTTPFGGFTIVS